MMRRSGSSPAVKRSKFACVTLRRAASDHMEATQLPKFAAAWRIAAAVIRGWPDAPSSPLQGGGAPSGPGEAGACGVLSDFCPEKILPKKFETPSPPEDWARTGSQASTAAENSSVAATVTIRLVIALPVQRILYPP